MKARNILVVLGLIVAVAATRFFPHPMNFSPVMSVALFGAAVFFNRYLGIAVAILAMIVSDIFLGFHSTLPFVYALMALAGVLGFFLREKRSPLKIAAMAISGSVLFFIITNFGVFLMTGMYSYTFEGLLTCYTMALPFFKNSLAGDLVFSGALFTLHYFFVKRGFTASTANAA